MTELWIADKNDGYKLTFDHVRFDFLGDFEEDFELPVGVL